MLKGEGYKLIKGRGVPKDIGWAPENSYLVLNMSKEKGTKIAKQFKQNAFVYGEVGQIPDHF